MTYLVTYDTLNDTYTKSFRSLDEAERFCGMIRKLYPDQNPKPYRK
jgi:hypothetical protein